MLAPKLPEPNVSAVYLDIFFGELDVLAFGFVADSIDFRTEGNEVLVEVCKDEGKASVKCLLDILDLLEVLQLLDSLS